jgi:hypothetical protein
MIAESAIKAKVNNFSKLTHHVGGKRLELFLQINILIYLVGSCIGYQIISKNSTIIYSLNSYYFIQKCPYLVRSW